MKIKGFIKIVALVGIVVAAMVLTATMLLYLPVIQDKAKKEALAYARKQFRLDLRLEHFSLQFPARIGLQKLVVMGAPTDTLLYAEKLQIRVALWPLLTEQILRVKAVRLENAALLFNDSVAGFGLNLRVAMLSVTDIHLSRHNGSIDAGQLLVDKLWFEAEKLRSTRDSIQKSSSVFPKTITFNRVQIRQSEGLFNDLTSGARYQFLLSYAQLEKGRYASDSLSLSLNEIEVRNSHFSIQPPASSPKEEKEVAATASVRINKILFKENSLHLDAPENSSQNHIAPSYLHPFPIHLDNIRLASEQLHFNEHGAGAIINDFSLKETRGFVLQKLSGAFHYDSVGVTVDNLLIKSRDSYAQIALSIPTTALTDESTMPFSGNVDMQIAFADMAHFTNLPLPAGKMVEKNGKIALESVWEGSRAFPILNRLHFSWPDFLWIDADGSLSLPDGAKSNLQRLTGSMHLKADFIKGPWSDWVMQLATIDTGLPIPPTLKIQASADGVRGAFLVDLQAELLAGKTSIIGSVQPALKAYDLRLTVDSAQIQQLFAHSDFGKVSGQLHLQGEAKHRKLSQWRMAAVGNLGPVAFRGRSLRGVYLEGALQEGSYTFSGESLDSLVQASWKMTGTLADTLQTLLADFEMPQLSFGLLGLSPSNLIVKGSLRVEAAQKGDSLLRVALSAPPSTLTLQQKIRRLPAFDAQFSANPQKTELLLRSGDLTLTASADTGMVAVAKQTKLLADSLSGWWKGNNPLPLQIATPFRFSFHARKNNFLAHFLRPDSILWNQISLQGGSLQPEGFSGSGLITGLSVKGVPIDSTLFRFEAISQAAGFDLRLASLPANRSYFSVVGLSGSLTPGAVAARFRFIDGKGTPLFHIETLTQTYDSLVITRITNPEPIIGGEVCRVNNNNHLSWHPPRRFSGNLTLSGETLRLTLRDVERDSLGNSAISMNMSGLKLQRLFLLLPGMEALSGELHADGLYVSSPGSMGIEGTLGISGFRYLNRPVGDIDMQITHRRTPDMAHQIRSLFHINKREALRAEGWYRPLLPDSALQMWLTLSELPLATANAFSADYVTFAGSVLGELSLTGSINAPNLEGAIRFREGKLHVVPTLADYTLSSDSLTFKNSTLSMGSFRLTDAAGRALTVKGTTGLTAGAALNLTLDAKNFQLINVPQNNTKAIATGRALADISAQIRGNLTTPVVRGSLHLLRGTRVTYVMRENLEPENDHEIVKFIALSDTAGIRRLYSVVPDTYTGGMELTAQLQIEKDASFTLIFAGDKGNRATVQGGGTLYYHLSPQSVTSLTGTYTLEGGNLEYKPFVNASVVKNSTITWTGMPMNPDLNLAAVKVVRANVEQQDRMARPVNFNVFLRMQNSLQQPTVTFDVQAPTDLAIQNQLATATPEEKQRQAVSLLVYGSYDLSGASTQNNEAGSAINAFMENQLNKLARQTVKGVDLSFGVDSHTASGAETPGQGTDYSYKISKTFLNNRASLRVGGKVSTYDDPLVESRNNLIDDISLEYVLNTTGTLFLRLFRQANYENLLEGEIIETGISLMHRKQYPRFSDIFRNRQKKAEPSTPLNGSGNE